MTVEATNDNGPLAVMTSFNRIGSTWAGGSYSLLTSVLRNKWGFNGFVLTDYRETSGFNYMEIQQMLGAGGDAVLISTAFQKIKNV